MKQVGSSGRDSVSGYRIPVQQLESSNSNSGAPGAAPKQKQGDRSRKIGIEGDKSRQIADRHDVRDFSQSTFDHTGCTIGRLQCSRWGLNGFLKKGFTARIKWRLCMR